MHLIENNPEVLSRVISADEIDLELAACIREDFESSREPSSYQVTAKALLLHEEVADDEDCVVVALPGHLSRNFPATDEMPGAVVETTPRGRFACILLRGQRVCVPTHAFGFRPQDRLLILYLFDDAMFLDIVPNTEALQEDMWVHEMSAQSHAHPTYGELEAEFGPSDNDDRNLPVIVLTNKTVNTKG